MTPEGPPPPPPVVTETPPATPPQSIPPVEVIPPASAEPIPAPTLDTAHKQVEGWVGRIDLNLEPGAIIDIANKIEGRPPIPNTPENIALVTLAQHQERINLAEKAKKLEATAATPPAAEEPPEESGEQVRNRISDAFEKGMTTLVAESDANLWDENAPGISAEDKAIRVAARRFKTHISATEAYKTEMVNQENTARRNTQPPRPDLTEAEEKTLRENLHRELRKKPAQLKTKQYAYDGQTEKFVVFASDGKTIVDQFMPAELVTPMRTSLKTLAEQKGSDGKPTLRAAEAQEVNDVLDRYYKDGAFPARTESELRLERRKEIAVSTADRISQSIIEKAADDIEAKKTPEVDFYLSSLAVWRTELQNLPTDATPETINAYTAIVTTATNELLEIHPELKNDPALTDSLKLLQGNTEHYSNVANNPLAKRVKEVMKHIKYPPEGGNVDALITKLGPGKMLLITASLDTAVRADLEHPRPGRKARAAELVDRLLEQRIIDGDQGRFLSHLVQSQDVSTFTNTCADQLNLTPNKLKELSDPQKYLHKNAEKIAATIFGGKVSEKILEAFRALTKITPEMIAKYVKEHGLPMTQIMFALMVLPFIQSAMDTGGGGGEERGQGG